MATNSGVITRRPKTRVPEVDHIEWRRSSGQTVLNLAVLPNNPPAEISFEVVHSALESLTMPDDRRDSAGKRTVVTADKPAVNGRSVITPLARSEYTQAALERAAQVIRTAPEGVRNNTLSEQAPGIFELVNGGELDRATAENELTAAALAAGLDEKEILATLKSATNYVGDKARTTPEEDAAFSSNGQEQPSQVGDIVIPVPINGAEFAARKFDPLRFLIADLMACGHFVLLGGRPKSGKSWLMLTLAMCVDLGRPFLGKQTEAARVLYIALEDGQRRVNNRMMRLKWKPCHADFLFNIAQFDGPGGDLGPGLIQLAELTGSYDLILVDTLIKTLSGRADENNNPQMGAIANELARIAHATDTAIIVSHHTGKGQAEDPFDKLRGASAIRGAYDVGLVLDRKQDESEAVLHAESRDVDVENMTLRQAVDGAGWEYIGPGYQIENIRAGKKTLEAMLSHPEYLDGLTVTQIAEMRAVSEQTTRTQLNSLEASGHVRRESPNSTAMGKRPDLWFISDGYRG